MDFVVPPSGLGTALVTPFHRDGGLDLASLESLTEWQIASGVDLLVPCGSTGEAATLTEDETAEVVRTVAHVAAGRVPVYAGSTHNSTREAVRRAAKLAAIDGVTGILTANPYYSKPTQQGQYLHFRAIAEAIGKPLILYNIPGRTAANLLPETAARLSELPNIVAVKESSGNLEQIAELIALTAPGISVFAGDDALALPVIASGGAGLISVASNIAPFELKAMLANAGTGKWDAAKDCELKLSPLVTALFAEPNPSPVKALLAAIGRIDSATVRLPMVPVEPSTLAMLQAAWEALAAVPA